MTHKYIATSTNGAVVLYLATINPRVASDWTWTPDKSKAYRFVRKDNAAKYGTPVRVKA